MKKVLALPENEYLRLILGFAGWLVSLGQEFGLQPFFNSDSIELRSGFNVIVKAQRVENSLIKLTVEGNFFLENRSFEKRMFKLGYLDFLPTNGKGIYTLDITKEKTALQLGDLFDNTWLKSVAGFLGYQTKSNDNGLYNGNGQLVAVVVRDAFRQITIEPEEPFNVGEIQGRLAANNANYRPFLEGIVADTLSDDVVEKVEQAV